MLGVIGCPVSLFGPTLITFETTNVFDAVLGTVDARAIHGLNVRVVVPLKQFSALEGTRRGIANVALDRKG